MSDVEVDEETLEAELSAWPLEHKIISDLHFPKIEHQEAELDRLVNEEDYFVVAAGGSSIILARPRPEEDFEEEE